MGLVHRTATSHRDCGDIWDYVAEHGSPSAADTLLLEFDETLRLIADFPGMGQARPDLRPRLRSFPVGVYLLFYRPLRGGIELLRMLHGARDLRRVFRR